MSKKHTKKSDDQQNRDILDEQESLIEESAPAEGNAPDGGSAEKDQRQSDQQLQAERDDLYARLQRVSADYHNTIKRHQQQLEDQTRFVRGDLLKNLIPVLDHFDNALSTEPSSDDAKALHQGMAIVRDELLKVLEQQGVERLEVQIGEPFDPHRHEAMLRQPAEGVEPNHVTMLMQPGYLYGNRTLRAAKVAVAPEE